MQTKQITQNINLLCLDDDLKKLSSSLNQRLSHKVKIFSPICPDYSFEEKIITSKKRERVHDFSGMSDKKGIVYEKLIATIEPILKHYTKEEVEYEHFLLVADVEVKDNEILTKLGISAEKFLSNCNSTVKDINQDLATRGLENSIALNMSTFFENHNFDFYNHVEYNYQSLLRNKNSSISKYLDKVIEARNPLYNFWFGMDSKKGKQRAIHEVGMYAAFGMSPIVRKGIIMCADSEILSFCYNIFNQRNNIVPILYITGNY